MTIQELREKRAKAWDTAREFLDSKRRPNGTLSEEDSKTYDTLENEIVALGKEIQRMERAAEIDNELSKAASSPILGMPHNKITAGSDYSKDFWDNIRTHRISDALQVGTDSEGGFLVPDEFEKRLVEQLADENIFRKIATIITTSSGERKIPVVAGKGSADWLDEEGAYQFSDDTFGQISLSAHKCGTAIKVSEELLNDSAFDLESYIAREFSRRIGAKEEEAFFVGNGVGKPTGIFNATGGAADGATTLGASIAFDDIIELFHSVNSAYRNKAVWVLNDSTIKLLRKLKDNNGNYIWQPSVAAGIPDTILNKPYYTSNYIPTAAAGNKCMAFGDFSYYWISDRKNITFKRLNELFAANGQVGFLAAERVDGKLTLSEAIKTLKIKE